MKHIALTGSIGMGKSTTLAMFRDLAVRVWDADAAVHRIYARDGAGVGPVGALFPDCVTKDGTIDRQTLSKIVLTDTDKLKQLEAIVHPLVGIDRARFIEDAQKDGAELVILDIPLLFETDGQKRVDGVIVVSCDPALQRKRVLTRPGMTPEKFEAISARQTPDAIKRSQADFVITTNVSLDDTRKQVESVLEALKKPKPSSS